MVLITDDKDGGVAASLRVKQLQQLKGGAGVAQIQPARVEEEDYRGSWEGGQENEEEEEGDFEEVDFEDLDDTRSIVSDDSFYPLDDAFEDSPSPQSLEPVSFFRACCTNNAAIVRIMIRHGLAEEEVTQTDRNNRTGLLVACYQGYVDVVIALSQCPYLDANWQDSEGNTALITAAQAGHITITNYLLNYYSGLDIERRNCHGFTALMKAAVQGRVECVRSLMMAGATLNARDRGRQMTAREWALFTGRYETAWVMSRLMERSTPDQICDAYSLEWPPLASMVAKARREPRGCLKRLSDTVRDVFNVANVTNPEDAGVIDHLVSVTTAIRSPFIAVTCHTVCPDSPPSVGKRRYAVPEILHHQRAKELTVINPDRADTHLKLFQSSRVTLVPKPSSDRRASLQTQSATPRAASSSLGMLAYNGMELRRTSLLPLHTLLRRSSVRPGFTIPKVRVSKAPPPTYEPEKVRRKSSAKDGARHLLQVPKWRYKELKEERRKAEEAERRRLEALTKGHLTVGIRK